MGARVDGWSGLVRLVLVREIGSGKIVERGVMVAGEKKIRLINYLIFRIFA